MDVIAQLDEIVPAVSNLAAGVRPDQIDNETPCANFRVRDLFDHLIAAGAIAAQLRGETPEAPPTLTDDERPIALKAGLADLLDAAKTPGAGERTVTLPFGAIPGEVVLRFLTVDGMTHATDIARATGQTYEPDPALVEEVLASARALIAPEMRDGETFAAETPVPADATALTRLIAFTGRAV